MAGKQRILLFEHVEMDAKLKDFSVYHAACLKKAEFSALHPHPDVEEENPTRKQFMLQ